MTFLKFYAKKLIKSLGLEKTLASLKTKNVDQRRFWVGAKIPAPSINTHLFSHLDKEAITLTYKKESRDCIYVRSGEEIYIPIVLGDARVRLSLACEGRPVLDKGIEVFADDIKVVDLKYIVPNKWHNCEVELGRGRKKLRVKNSCPAKVAFAHPIIQKSFASTAGNFPKNIVVLLLDSLSHDSIGAYNPTLEKFTPNITRFFKDSLRFENCFTQSEWTYPSIYSILMSRYPVDHGMYDLKIKALGIPGDFENTLPQQMRSLGYTTSAYSTVKVFHPAFGAHNGFDRFFYDPFPQEDQTHRQICEQAIMQLEQNNKGKNFLFLHFLDTHEPWTNPTEFEESLLPATRITDPMQEYEFYKIGHGDTKAEPKFDDKGIEVLLHRRNARLKYMDLSLQVLFDYLEKSGDLDNTAIILLSDHGYLYPGQSQPLLCDSRVHVPFLVRNPEFPDGGECSDLVELNMDLGPTILNMAGGKFRGGSGKVVSPFGTEKRKYVISESIFGNTYKTAIRDELFVYHFACEFSSASGKIRLNCVKKSALFERKIEKSCIDLSQKEPEIVERMQAILKEHLGQYPEKIYKD